MWPIEKVYIKQGSVAHILYGYVYIYAYCKIQITQDKNNYVHNSKK